MIFIKKINQSFLLNIFFESLFYQSIKNDLLVLFFNQRGFLLTNDITTPGIVGARIESDSYSKNFDDLYKPFNAHEAFVAADRCYFCYDAPCVVACPTDIDIPLFIRQISTGTPKEAAKTILEQNILGGMCEGLPTETL